ncbi:MAG: hypothetical protein HWN65_14080 [Candidatus Helarchaeota archaeon]|nr:hypothetical protein [Candidatus Helarchaeota archaeon]
MVESKKAFGGIIVFIVSVLMISRAYLIWGFGYAMPPAVSLGFYYLIVISWIQLLLVCFALFSGLLLFRNRGALLAIIFGFALLGLAIVNVIVLYAGKVPPYTYTGGENLLFIVHMVLHLCLFPSLIVLGGFIGLGSESE